MKASLEAQPLSHVKKRPPGGLRRGLKRDQAIKDRMAAPVDQN